MKLSSRPHPKNQRLNKLSLGAVGATLLAVGVLTTQCHQKVETTLASETEITPSEPSFKKPKKVVQTPVKRVSPSVPENFFKGELSDPLPTTGNGDVNMVKVLIGINQCKIWDRCEFVAQNPCKDEDDARPIQCNHADGWLNFTFDKDTQTLGIFSDACGKKEDYVPAIAWSNDPDVLCDRLSEYEEARIWAIDALTADGSFFRSGTGDGRYTFDLNPAGRTFTMVLDDQIVRVTKWNIDMEADGRSGAAIKVAGILMPGSERRLKVFHVDAFEPEDLVDEIEALKEALELKEEDSSK